MMTADKVTLCCIDTEHHELSRLALRQCNKLMPFAKTVFLTDKPEFVDEGWEFHRISRLANYEEFNKFMLKHVYFHIDTEFALIVQFDGFILNADSWTDEFLRYDYIGAPWPCSRKEYAVGTGGFSLRSKKLLKALQDDRINLPKESPNEDLCFCRTYRSLLEVHHDIAFAPVELATQFCYESGPFIPDTLGFHSLLLLADVYSGFADVVIDNLQEYLMKKSQATCLALQFAFRGQDEAAARLFKRLSQYQTQDVARQHLIASKVPDSTVAYFEEAWPKFVS